VNRTPISLEVRGELVLRIAELDLLDHARGALLDVCRASAGVLPPKATSPTSTPL
jgi:hypothetical protein